MIQRYPSMNSRVFERNQKISTDMLLEKRRSRYGPSVPNHGNTHDQARNKRMVVFSCDGCGETLKKSQVDAHSGRCRRCQSVSCMDCCVSFYGDDYRSHTSCVTESERYEKGCAPGKRKRNPQQDWMDIVETCATLSSSHPPGLRGYLKSMATLDNIPRKEKQFRNFVANSLHLRGASSNAIVGQLWDVLNAEREKRQTTKQQQQQKSPERQQGDTSNPGKNAQAENGETDAKQLLDNSAQQMNDADTKPDEKQACKATQAKMDEKKVWKAMKRILKKAPNRTMKVRKLRKVLLQRLELPRNAKKEMKKLLAVVPSSGSKDMNVVINGKLMTLK